MHGGDAEIVFARRFALQAHGSQMYGTRPYEYHLRGVVRVLSEEGDVADRSILTAAWLHDVVEDTHVTIRDIYTLFGSRVASIVGAVTDDEGDTRADRKRNLVSKLAHAGEQAVTLKQADRLFNFRTAVADRDRARILMYATEHYQFFHGTPIEHKGSLTLQMRLNELADVWWKKLN